VQLRHREIATENGPYRANACMRTLRAVYNHARKTSDDLPADNPTDAVDWRKEKRRDTAMGAADLTAWFAQLGQLSNPIRREFHLFTLLSGSRPAALLAAKVADLDFKRRVLHIPEPKGGAEKAYNIPLSRPMIRCLVRAMRASRALHPFHARTWVFAGRAGHMASQQEDRSDLSKYGNDLRQSFRTLGHEAELSEIDMHVLMNHRLAGVNAGYLTKDVLAGKFHQSQEKLSKFILTAAGERTDWPFTPARRSRREAIERAKVPASELEAA
jgi:integrase